LGKRRRWIWDSRRERELSVFRGEKKRFLLQERRKEASRARVARTADPDVVLIMVISEREGVSSDPLADLIYLFF